MIDAKSEGYEEYCRMVDIPNVYANQDEFLTRYPFDTDNPDSIASTLYRAYDNAIVLRESIGSEALSYVQLAIYDMKKAEQSEAPMIELQKVIDNILAFWGIADDWIDSEQIRNIIKAGKRIERVDMYARLGVRRSELIREVYRMIPRVEKCGRAYDIEMLNSLRTMVVAENIDYYKIVETVEDIF